jgi:hypothetical protein
VQATSRGEGHSENEREQTSDREEDNWLHTAPGQRHRQHRTVDNAHEHDREHEHVRPRGESRT